MIDENEIKPKQLCECGYEEISIPLSNRCSKKGTIKRHEH